MLANQTQQGNGGNAIDYRSEEEIDEKQIKTVAAAGEEARELKSHAP
jgi:hypothetical protein